MEKKISSKNTKNEILAAYEEMLKEVEKAQSADPKKEQEEKKKQEIIKNTSNQTSDSIVQEVAGLKIKLAKELDSLSDAMLSEQKKLEDLQKTIALEKTNLEELYQISANADSLAALFLAQKEQKAAFNEEMDRKKEELNFEIKNTREAWEIEKRKHTEQQKEEKAEMEKKREREEEEYAYALNLSRKKDKDTYEAKKEALENELNEKRKKFNQEIAEREHKVAEAEQELKELRLQAEMFPKKLDKAVSDAIKATEEKLTASFNFEKQLTSKHTEGEIKLKEQTIISLKEKIKEQEAFIRELTGKANNAEKSVKDIAIKAIESSGKVSLFEKQPDDKKHE